MNSVKSCIDFSNSFAPEHLELLVNSPDKLLSKITNAGSIFLGKNSAEAFGDYIAGPVTYYQQEEVHHSLPL